METNSNLDTKQNLPAKQTEQITIDLQYLTADQARRLINMFDTMEAYAENFSAIKAITRGLYSVLEGTDPIPGSPVLRMFHTVNSMQDTLMQEDMQEHFRIIDASGLMPDPWSKLRSQKGGGPCV